MSTTSGVLPPVPGPASPTTASVPVAAAIVGGSAAALALIILLTWLTRREGAWAQSQRRHAERETNLRREARTRHTNASATENEVQPADVRPDLKRPTPFLVLHPGSEMVFGLKEIIVESDEKTAAMPKGRLELEQCKPIDASHQENLAACPAQGTAATSAPAASDNYHPPQQPLPQSTLLSHQSPFWVPAQLTQHQSASSGASPR